MPRVFIIAAALAWSGAALAADLPDYKADLPNAELTPGEANPVLTQEKICGPGFRTGPFRNVSAALKRRVYAAYGMRNHAGRCAGKEGCEIDHDVPLYLGGANTLKNLWPQQYSGTIWNAHVKDNLEVLLHKLVCGEQMSLQEAQQCISSNWIECYKSTIGEQPSGRKKHDRSPD